MKQRLFIEFEDYNVSKLILVLNIVDDLNVSIINNELKDSLKKLTPYENLFLYLFSCKFFIENADRVAIQQ